jgi:hypothetical protein
MIKVYRIEISLQKESLNNLLFNISSFSAVLEWLIDCFIAQIVILTIEQSLTGDIKN